jgi:hypothetical protein
MYPNLRWVLPLLWLTAEFTFGQEPENKPDSDAAKKFQAYAKEAAGAYDIKVRAGESEERKTLLRDEPILRWTNPIGARNAHGEVFLWTDDGRPAAAMSLYQWTGPDGVVHEHHEFCSLATGPLVTSGPGTRDWSPREAGVTPAPLPEALAAASPRQRLGQMRELAGRFTAKKTTRQKETRTLRLLTQPVYRFESKLNDVTDGALFAFVEATDPEIFLLLEARTAKGKLQWHYGFVRMTSVRLEASLNDKEVWQADELPWRDTLNRTDMPYTAFSVK